MLGNVGENKTIFNPIIKISKKNCKASELNGGNTLKQICEDLKKLEQQAK